MQLFFLRAPIDNTVRAQHRTNYSHPVQMDSVPNLSGRLFNGLWQEGDGAEYPSSAGGRLVVRRIGRLADLVEGRWLVGH